MIVMSLIVMSLEVRISEADDRMWHQGQKATRRYLNKRKRPNWSPTRPGRHTYPSLTLHVILCPLGTMVSLLPLPWYTIAYPCVVTRALAAPLTSTCRSMQSPATNPAP